MGELARINEFLVSFEVHGRTIYLSTKSSRIVLRDVSSVMLHKVRRDNNGIALAIVVAMLGGLFFGLGETLFGLLLLAMGVVIALYYGNQIGVLTIETKRGNTVTLQVSWNMGNNLVMEFYSQEIPK
ncbi:hypothetical protein [Thermococcus sp.]